MSKPSLDDYIEVPERILQFYKDHPKGSLACDLLEFRDLPGKDGKVIPHVVYRASAFRTPDDPKPGQGTATEPIPGLTPYTKGSEVMNAETSAWGRALAALGYVSNKKIASREEVRNRQVEASATAATNATTIPVSSRGPAPSADPVMDKAREALDGARGVLEGGHKQEPEPTVTTDADAPAVDHDGKRDPSEPIGEHELGMLRDLIAKTETESKFVRMALIEVEREDVSGELDELLPKITVGEARHVFQRIKERQAA